MKKQYIKFIEGNQESLDKACKLAEKHGYKKWENKNALQFEWKWVLECDQYGDFYVTISSEEELIEYNYTEIKTELKEEPEWVYISNVSEEVALRSKDKRILITTLPGKAVNKYVCVGQWDEEAYLRWDKYDTYAWSYAVPVPTEEKKERKLMMTDSEWEEFKSRNNIKE